MMQKLNALNYLKNNKKRAMILIVSFAIFITLLYGLRFFINPAKYTHENVVLGKSKYVQGVFINRGDILNLDHSLWEKNSTATNEDKIYELNRAVKEFGDRLALNPGIDYVIACSTYNIPISTLISNQSYQVPLLDKEQVNTLCEYLNITISEGEIPQEPGEFLIDKRMAANRKLKIGDSINNDNTKITGILNSSFYFAVGIHFDDNFVKRSLIFLNNNYLTDVQKFFEDLGYSADYSNYKDIKILWDMKGGKEEVLKNFGELDPVLRVIMLITTFIIAGTLFIVYQLHIQDRYEEWCLYRSLGFSQSEIYGLAAKEFLFCMGSALILASLLCSLLVIVGGIFMDHKGIVYQYWMPEVFGQILAALVFMAGILHIPVLSAMRQIKTIDAIHDDF